MAKMKFTANHYEKASQKSYINMDKGEYQILMFLCVHLLMYDFKGIYLVLTPTHKAKRLSPRI